MSVNVSSKLRNANPKTFFAFSLEIVYAFSGNELMPGFPCGVRPSSCSNPDLKISQILWDDAGPVTMVKRSFEAAGTVAARRCADYPDKMLAKASPGIKSAARRFESSGISTYVSTLSTCKIPWQEKRPHEAGI